MGIPSLPGWLADFLELRDGWMDGWRLLTRGTDRHSRVPKQRWQAELIFNKLVVFHLRSQNRMKLKHQSTCCRPNTFGSFEGDCCLKRATRNIQAPVIHYYTHLNTSVWSLQMRSSLGKVAAHRVVKTNLLSWPFARPRPLVTVATPVKLSAGAQGIM